MLSRLFTQFGTRNNTYVFNFSNTKIKSRTFRKFNKPLLILIRSLQVDQTLKETPYTSKIMSGKISCVKYDYLFWRRI